MRAMRRLQAGHIHPRCFRLVCGEIILADYVKIVEAIEAVEVVEDHWGDSVGHAKRLYTRTVDVKRHRRIAAMMSTHTITCNV
jgi:hypothetical protein